MGKLASELRDIENTADLLEKALKLAAELSALRREVADELGATA